MNLLEKQDINVYGSHSILGLSSGATISPEKRESITWGQCGNSNLRDHQKISTFSNYVSIF